MFAAQDERFRSGDHAEQLRRVLNSIGHPNRRNLLLALAEGADRVATLERLTQLSKSVVRTHLLQLMHTDLVSINRAKRPYLYCLTPKVRVRRRQETLYVHVELPDGQSVKIVTAQ